LFGGQEINSRSADGGDQGYELYSSPSAVQTSVAGVIVWLAALLLVELLCVLSQSRLKAA
jgi:hypothetical protein